MKKLKLILIIFLGLNIYTHAYSKPFDSKIIFESEFGGIYAFKNPWFHAPKGSYVNSFKEINNFSNSNCEKYSKKSYFFVQHLETGMRSMFTIQKDGGLLEGKNPGFIPDDTIDVKLMWNHYRFYCAKDTTELFLNHSSKDTIFPFKFFNIASINIPYVVGDISANFASFENNKFIIKNRQEEETLQVQMNLKMKNTNKISKVRNMDHLVEGNIAYANYNNAILESKRLCKKMGYKDETESFFSCAFKLMNISDSYEQVKIQDNILSSKVKNQANVRMESRYLSSAGNNITNNKEGVLSRLWKGVSWVMHEHGEEIIKLVVDLKYGTNYSGSNTSTEVSNNRGGLRCVQQRVGDVIHQNCKGGGVHIYCMYVIITDMTVRKTCRDKTV